MTKRTFYVAGSALLAAALATAFFAGRALAGGIPATGALTYSGSLQDASGAPIAGSHNIQVNFWTTATGGTTPDCQTPSASMALDAGRFSVALPDTCTNVVKANANAWAEVMLDGASLGRTKLGAVPYAVEAGHATSADTATSATNATNAANATNATSATNATNATSATNATNASNATGALAGQIAGPWTSYTPTLVRSDNQGAIPNTSSSGSWRRVGDSVEAFITTSVQAASATPAGVYWVWGLPPGLSIAASKMPGTYPVLGSAEVITTGNSLSICVASKASTSFTLDCQGSVASFNGNTSTPVISGTNIYIHVFVPVNGLP